MSKKRFKSGVPVVAAVLTAWALLVLLRVSSFSGENSVDSFYHVRAADAGPAFYMSKKFPTLEMSSWRERFSDKELGFHMVLSGIRRAGRAFGVPEGPPFNFGELLFPLLVLTAFAYAARRFGAGIWTTACSLALLSIASPFFTDRLLMLRPHNLFIALVLLSFPILAEASRPRDAWRPFLLGFVGAWCYSNPHFLLLPAAGFALAGFRRRLDWWWLPPLAVAGGIVAGFTIHPQFPNTFLNWKTQCVDVVWRALGGGAEIAIGNEFKRPDWSWFLKNAVPLGMAAFSMWLAWRAPRGDGASEESAAEKDTGQTSPSSKTPLPGHIQALLFSTVVACAAVPLGIRAMEYACPFALLSFCAVSAEYRRAGKTFPYPFDSRKTALGARILVALSAMAFLVFQGENYRARKPIKPFGDFAAWAASSKIPGDAFVANLVWSDFPMLLYARPNGKYLSGMDPMFSHAAFPKRTTTLERIRLGREKATPAELAELLGTKLAFISARYRVYAEHLKGLGCVAIYEGRDGWLFDLGKSGKKMEESGDNGKKTR
jgi:hypothetical protein